jgi:hypothetical protein
MHAFREKVEVVGLFSCAALAENIAPQRSITSCSQLTGGVERNYRGDCSTTP